MLSSLALALAFTVAAPVAKDPPSIVGEWESVSPGGITMKFTADNTLIINEAAGRDKSIYMTYKVDFTTTPMEIDMMILYADPHIPPGKPTKCILKFEDDNVLIRFPGKDGICFSGKNEPRPTNFESTAGSKNMLLTLKRKKQK